MERGLIHIYCGDGKKERRPPAVGLAVRLRAAKESAFAFS